MADRHQYDKGTRGDGRVGGEAQHESEEMERNILSCCRSWQARWHCISFSLSTYYYHLKMS